MTARVPETIGRYQLLEPLGGGSGPGTFRAILEGPTGFRKQVAVRLLEGEPTELIGGGASQVLVRHPSVVDFYDVGKGEEGQWFAAMELVDGPSLTKLIAHFGALPGRAVVELGVQAAAGLSAVHRAGLVHGYLTSDELLVGSDGQTKIGGLGLTGRALGYQPLGIPVASEPWSDVFAMGVLLWQAVLGHHPLRRRTARDTAMAVMEAGRLVRKEETQRALAAAAPGLEAIVPRCVDDVGEDRFTEVRDLRRALVKLRPRESEGLVELLARYDIQTAEEPDTLRLPVGPVALDLGPLPEEGDEPLFGRSREQAAVLAKLRSGERAITLKALSGMGKTRLALRLAHLWQEEGPVVIWCGLNERPELATLLSAVGDALQLEFDGASVEDLHGQVGRALSALERATLVLDGLEIVDPEVSLGLGGLLEQAPDLQILATSHCPLGVPREVLFELGPLPIADAMDLLEHAAPDRIEGAQRASLERLVRAVDAVPLGIRMAASTLADTSAAMLLERLLERSAERPLDQSIDLHLQASPDWVVAALAQLSVFDGRFTLDAATAVLDLQDWPEAPWPVDVVQSLWNRSMISVRARASHTELWLLASVRRRARENLERLGLTSSARRAHASWFARMGTREALARLRAPGGLARTRALTRAYGDLLSATRWALEEADVDLAVPLTLAVGEVIRVCGPPAVGLDLVDRCLTLGPTPGMKANLLLLRAELAQRAGDGEGAIDALDQAERAARRHPQLLALVGLGRAHFAVGREDARSSARTAKLAMRRARSAGDSRCLAESARLLGIARRDQGKTGEAETLLLKARSMFERLGDDAGAAGVDQSLGLLYQGMGQFDDAIQRHSLSADANRRAGRIGPRAVALHALGVALTLTQRYTEAESIFREALATFRALGNLGGEANCLGGLSDIQHSRGDSKGAMEGLAKAAGIHRELGSWRQFAVASNNLANLHAEAHDFDQARTLYASSLEACRAAGLVRMMSLPMGNLGVVLVDLGQLTEGTRRLKEAITLAMEAKQFRFVAGFAGELARGLLLLGDVDGCAAALEDAVPRLREIGDRVELAKTLAVRAMWHHRRGESDGAEQALAEAARLLEGNRNPSAWARIHGAQKALS